MMMTGFDPVGSLRKDFSTWHNMLYRSLPTTWDEILQPHLLMLIVIIIAAVVFITVLFMFRNIKTKVEEVTASIVGPSKPRFRKRDKVMFYGRKMLRKVSTFSNLAVGGRSRMKKKQMVLRFAKRLLRLKRDQPLTLQVKEPSQAFLEEDVTEQSEQRLPPEVIYMLKSIRVFGFFEKPLFLDICKNIEVISVAADNLLFSIGDPDDSIYVVQSGRLQVFVTEPDGTELVLKEVPPGESIASLLSVMDVLTGHVAPYKTVSARAIKDSNILKLRVQVFKQLLEKYPESLVRVAQIIMIRLHRVTFTALHNYLGLTTQLMNPASVYKKVSVVASPKASPSRPSTLKVVPEGKEVQTSKPEVNLGSKPSIDSTIPESPCEGVPPTESTSENNLAPISVANSASVDVNSVPPSPQKLGPGVVQFQDQQKTRRRRTSFMLLDEKGQPLEPGDLIRVATEGFMLHLGLQDPSLLKDRIAIQEHPAGIYLTREEMHSDAVLYFILSGTVVVSQKTVDKETEDTLFIAYPGEVVGALAVITGEPSLFTIKTRHPCRLGVMSKNNIYEILRKRPKAVLELARAVIKRLSSFVRQIDFALDWMHIESGRAIYRQGDSSDSTYIVLSGRLRSVLTRSDGKKELVGEYGRGDLVGIVEVLTQTERSTTVMAVRDSELAKLPEGLLNAIKIKYPVVVTRLVHLLGHRILGSLRKDDALTGTKGTYLSYIRPSASNFATVAVLSVTDDVPLSSFTMELYHALTSIGPVFRITSDIIKKTLGPTVLESANEYRLCSWLGQQEDQHRIVLYQCDNHFSAWTQRCIRQADCILIVALADQEPTVGQIEKQLEHLAVRTQKELILLHKEGADKPRNTVQWLNMRSWCSSHHHIRCPKRMFAKKSPTKILEQYNKLFETPPSLHSDFSRLARFLTGTSIGLVLGGGGARGAAHVGMIRAIQEAGIPVDMVGGVSIGAFMGALWCQENNITTFTQKARDWSFKMTSYWRQILDLTYPVTAMFTGAAFNRTIHEVFGERQIEDLWLPYFTVTTDITESTMRVHTHGSLWRYIRSSMSLSGYMPPLCDPVDGHLLLDGGYVNNLPGGLWRYVRASMTFTGPLPPLCDPLDGHLLVDGCYVNNLPADIMREMGAETIIAVDVGSQDDLDLTNYGDTLSGWWLLWKRWNPWASPVKVPSLPEIQSRLAYVSCVRQLEQVKRSDYCTYVRPPIDKYKTLQFGSFDEIMDVGYNHGKTIFNTLKRGHRSLHSFIHDEKTAKQRHHHHHHPTNLRNATFTDLAEMVCKIQPPRRLQVSDVSDSEFEDDDQDDLYISEPESNILEEVTKPPIRRRKLGSCSNIDADSL